jgi:hypothetical protein
VRCVHISPYIFSRSPSVTDHANFESLNRNRISNVSFAVASVGELAILAVMVGILKGIKSDASTENNTKAFSILIAFSGAVWRRYSQWLLSTVPESLKQSFSHSHGLFSRSGGLVLNFLRELRTSQSVSYKHGWRCENA